GIRSQGNHLVPSTELPEFISFRIGSLNNERFFRPEGGSVPLPDCVRHPRMLSSIFRCSRTHFAETELLGTWTYGDIFLVELPQPTASDSRLQLDISRGRVTPLGEIAFRNSMAAALVFGI